MSAHHMMGIHLTLHVPFLFCYENAKFQQSPSARQWPSSSWTWSSTSPPWRLWSASSWQSGWSGGQDGQRALQKLPDINHSQSQLSNTSLKRLQHTRLGWWNVTSTESTTRPRLGWRTFKRQRTRSTECTKCHPSKNKKSAYNLYLVDNNSGLIL